ncbi:MAG: hypothetical protein GY727_15320 [Gammaproteobacteria bacterium]|nr:hypothetical protein [Gammaproteobacteria bacterium]MCP4091403.1 hypothetical protein [Gammaproteobacteria bacterium]MCP4275639.1 hypothetical protein [Gammaproteobacteria bacterium]MCP4831437.1 hypothetical protein [Gammaproteobacteria bacterium]MCP4930211.1 hypothetical protein [Gammaproteobacteria bacterium]
MGFFDLPAPLFTALDNLMNGLPSLPRLLIWSALTAVLSMALYWLCSAQDKVASAKERALVARRKMAAYQGTEFDEMMPLAKESLIASGKHFGIVLWPALLSSLPALTIIVWVSAQFSYTLPQPGSSLNIYTDPAVELVGISLTADNTYTATYPDANGAYAIVTTNGEQLVTLPLSAPVPVVHKRQWWNSLIGNPNGYLADALAIDAIHFELPTIEYLAIGPSWIRGWEFSYFSLLIIVSLGIKVVFRIH